MAVPHAENDPALDAAASTSGSSWTQEHQRQLTHLAETDALPDGLDWPSLRTAIKARIRETSDTWSPAPPTLHNAAYTLPDEVRSGEDAQNGAPDPLAAAQAGLQSRFQSVDDGRQRAAAAGVEVKDADLQSFYPAKTRPPPGSGGSWARRLDRREDMEAERDALFRQLDEFESDPPFTIQRLAEVVLEPRRHYQNVPRYFSALQRLLSVTATRDAFPVAPPATGASGSGAGKHVNGAAMQHDVSISPAATPSTFSPIPFLVRDAAEMDTTGAEGGGGEEAGGGAAGQEVGTTSGEGGSAGAKAAMGLDEIPVMELGGADRTTAEGVEAARLSGAGVSAPGAATHEDLLNRAAGPRSSGAAAALAGASAAAAAAAAASATAATTTAGASPSTPSSSSSALTANVGGPSADGAPATGGGDAAPRQVLGVPSGPVDEMDVLLKAEARQAAAAATATGVHGAPDSNGEAGTSGASAQGASAASASDVDGKAARQGEEEEEEGGRVVKRMRSDASLGADGRRDGASTTAVAEEGEGPRPDDGRRAAGIMEAVEGGKEGGEAEAGAGRGDGAGQAEGDGAGSDANGAARVPDA